MPRFRKKKGSGVWDSPKFGEVKAGDIIEGEISDIPKGFRDTFEMISDSSMPVPADDEEIPVKPKVGLKVVPVKGKRGKYDVVNENSGDKVNTDPLTKKEAEQLVKESTENLTEDEE